MQFTYKNHIINLLDTPGHQDFSEDTYRVLTAVDSSLMIIDAAKGVEEQTIKLLNVCRLKNMPIITFINKYDREVRDSIELLDEVESILKIRCAPITWPVGSGKNFKGVYHILNDEIYLFAPGQNKITLDLQVIQGINNPVLDKLFPMEIDQLRTEIELVKIASNSFVQQEFLIGALTPVFFGSAINNFGIQEILEALIQWTPCPQPEKTLERLVNPNESSFSGFVFKIQANMDPKHRDRIAFLRICSGKLSRNMKIKHLRLNREMSASSIVTFMSDDRVLIEEAYAGDIVGIPNHGNIQIGDSFSEGDELTFTGIPCFAPEIFKKVIIKNPLKTKQLYKGLQQLGEEGAIQIFKPLEGGNIILGAVGLLQFEVVIFRLQEEYSVDALFEPINIWSARWISATDPKQLDEFQTSMSINLSIDAGGHLTYLAPNKVNLQLTEERWSKIDFHTTREYSAKFNQ